MVTRFLSGPGEEGPGAHRHAWPGCFRRVEPCELRLCGRAEFSVLRVLLRCRFANCRPPSASAFEDFRPAASSCWRISAQSKVTGERWLLQQPGFSATRIRQLGGGATQLSINAGNPVISGSQFDLGAFVGDDYKVRPNFSLSLELRYEARRTAGAGGVDGVGGFIQSESGNREREYRSEPELLAQCGAGIFSESATDRRLERQTRFIFCSSGTKRGSVRSIYRAWR